MEKDNVGEDADRRPHPGRRRRLHLPEPAGIRGRRGLRAAFIRAAHRVAIRLETKPEVCWQLPIRRAQDWVDRPDGTRVLVSTLSEFDRRGWGEGGHDLHWCCTSSPERARRRRTAVCLLRAELTALIGPKAYAELSRLCEERLEHGLVAEHPATVDARD